MKVLYYQVLLEKNEHFSQPCWVYPWEMPVFAAVHRKSGMTDLGKRAFNKRFAPNAKTEYDRLENKYKGPEGSDMTYVAGVYGHGSVGIKKLHEAMVEAAKETEAFLAAEALAPVSVAQVDAPEFASPFAGEELPEGADGIETQADLRNFVGGDADEPVAIAQ
jgi:hypothetical protein